MSQIVLDRAPPPKEPPPLKINGSPITAAANTVAVKTAEQAQAVNALGGRMTGGATVEVHNIPMTPSAGGSNHATVFASIMGAMAQLAVLVVGYTLVVDKKMMRSDFVFYFFIFNVVCLVGVIVVWAFLQDKQISID